ncbi:MAG: L-tyrosine/L-tryptophan isonitrile synthase family protein, partial [Candidatus Rokuibacteriota bacterium]
MTRVGAMADAAGAPVSGDTPVTPEVRRALDSLGPLLPADEATLREPFRGRRYEYPGPRDARRAEAERTTDDLEGLDIHDSCDVDPRQALAAITPASIADLVEAAILQSAPERALADPKGNGTPLVHPPPEPAAVARVPALALGRLVDAVDADARRFAFDPDQQMFRARALLATDLGSRALNREAARSVADEVGELLRLEARSTHEIAAQRRQDALARDFDRRRRFASAFALAARRITATGRLDAPTLYRAFDAVAGLDKAPFRRGPSEHLTRELLAQMGVEFYRGLTDPAYRVTFLLLTFPIKNSSGLRTNVSTEAADAGELLMLAQLRRLLEFLTALGLPNVRFVCLTDGIVYSRYLGPYDRLQAIYYRENVRHFRDALGLADRVVIVDADPLLRRIPGFEDLLRHAHAMLDRA